MSREVMFDGETTQMSLVRGVREICQQRGQKDENDGRT